MTQKHLTADLKDTALVIECPICHSASVLADPRDGFFDPRNEHHCFNYNELLFALDSRAREVVALYRRLRVSATVS